jgi:hypothetical protein
LVNSNLGRIIVRLAPLKQQMQLASELCQQWFAALEVTHFEQFSS